MIAYFLWCDFIILQEDVDVVNRKIEERKAARKAAAANGLEERSTFVLF